MSVKAPKSLQNDTASFSRLTRLVSLLTLKLKCKTPHRIPRDPRESLRFCVWCGDCVCASCDTSHDIPHSHRLRRLCFDCWRLCVSGTETAATATGGTNARGLLCTCTQGVEWICPDCPPPTHDGPSPTLNQAFAGPNRTAHNAGVLGLWKRIGLWDE